MAKRVLVTALLMFLNEELSLQVFEGSQSDIAESGTWRKFPEADLEFLFYDWIFDAEDAVTAFEIHPSLPERTCKTRVPLRSLSYVEFDPFPRIWLSDSRAGDPAGLEAFGGIDFFVDAKDNLMIAVDTDWGVSADQLQQLINR